MSAIRRVWGLENFRTQLQELVALNAEDRARLFGYMSAATAADADDVQTEVLNEPLTKEEGRLLPLIDTLIQVRDREGTDALVADLEMLEQATGWGLTAALGPHLSTPRESANAKVHRAQTNALPVAEDAHVYLDFRAVDALDAETGRVNLAPVAILRLSFDEHVNGSDAAVFQMEDAQLNALADKIEEYRRRRDELLNLLPAELRPDGPGVVG